MRSRVTMRLAVLSVALFTLAAGLRSDDARSDKLDSALLARAARPRGRSQVIIRTVASRARPGAADPLITMIDRVGGVSMRALEGQARVAVVPDAALLALADDSRILTVSLDRAVISTAIPVAMAAGAVPLPPGDRLGLDGSGVGVATIDSGVAQSDDLGPQRVVHWADFVTRLGVAYDDYGHGTHVAGIIAGSGARDDSASGSAQADIDPPGSHRGVAPGADLIVLKALDGTGSGHVSDVIAAVDYAIANRHRFNIRVINLSVAAGVYESAATDPLAQAALRAVRAGIVVVAAAGNFGSSQAGEAQYGSITAPGNAPWVLTVGATDDRGTPDRADDVVAGFSSRGPAAIDGTPKPDLVAPGVGIEAAADPASTLFATYARARVWGAARPVSQPYLRLSGTSMAAPAVTGTVALMVQAAPQLTPNAIKAILQFTAEPRPGVDQSTQGTGLLNIRGAVALARQLVTGQPDGATLEALAGGTVRWSRQIIWGARRVSGDFLLPSMPAWDLDVTWGADLTSRGEPVSWRGLCAAERPGCGASR